MIWIAPSEKDPANATLEKRLWDAADQFRANSGLKSQEYSAPVLGLNFLRQFTVLKQPVMFDATRIGAIAKSNFQTLEQATLLRLAEARSGARVCDPQQFSTS